MKATVIGTGMTQDISTRLLGDGGEVTLLGAERELERKEKAWKRIM